MKIPSKYRYRGSPVSTILISRVLHDLKAMLNSTIPRFNTIFWKKNKKEMANLEVFDLEEFMMLERAYSYACKN